MKSEEILAIYNKGPEAVIEIIQKQNEEIQALKEIVKQLTLRVQELEARLNQNSSNSNRPPSSDGLSRKDRRTKERKSKKKRGGQKGHEGSQLKMSTHPDKVLVHSVEKCGRCDCSLSGAPVKIDKRQVIDTPEIKTEVTEHRAEIKGCPHCGFITKASFPEGVTRPVQYGSRIKGLLTYLSQYQLIPYDRIAEFCGDILGIRMSTGTIYNANRQAYEASDPVEESIKNLLAQEPVLHADETGVFCGGMLKWQHVLSTDRLTYYSVHEKRGKGAIDDMGIIPGYRGRLMHDFWSPYLAYDCDHAFCNAHLIRELTSIDENYQQSWACEMIELLVSIKKHADARLNRLNESTVKGYAKHYDRIIAKGIKANPHPPSMAGCRGRKKKPKPLNLLMRMKNYKREILSFMYDVTIPFDNNQAERDLRMVKVQQKISGCFRSSEGGMFFARIRGYISTVKKNGVPVFGALQGLFENRPFMPQSAE
ncbi:MAG TPA: IS66 family transposase [Rectinema sp.]|nr:IS66 family transposase [Rectinema sp.]HPV59663.1 IS66 family transposase [Rectinema sp.]